MVSVDEVLAAAERIYRDTAVMPEVLRCSPDVAYDMQVEQAMLGGPAFRPAGEWPYALGLTQQIDPHLPAGVWRLTDADETLLYDCREGKQVP